MGNTGISQYLRAFGGSHAGSAPCRGGERGGNLYDHDASGMYCLLLLYQKGGAQRGLDDYPGAFYRGPYRVLSSSYA